MDGIEFGIAEVFDMKWFCKRYLLSMKTKLYENIGGNKFKLLAEAINPDRTKLVRAGIKKVFSTGDKEIPYYRLEGVGFGYIKDINTAKKCAIQESLDLAPEFGYENDEEEQKFVKQGVAKENRYASQNPEGPEFGSGVPGVWSDIKKVEELKKRLWVVMDAGDFDLAHKVVDELANYHN